MGVLDGFKKYMAQNELLFESAESAASIITDDAEYRAFKETILEGLDANEREAASAIMDRERAVILESADQMLGSSEAVAYAVANLALVTMSYNVPVLKKAIVTQPINKPVSSVNVLKYKAKIIDVDGSVKEVNFPLASESIRPGVKEIEFTDNISNVFKELGVSSNDFRISKRGLMFKKVKVTETDSDGNKIEHNVEIYSALDARGHTSTEFTITDADGVEAKFVFTGTVNPETGDINWSVNLDPSYNGNSTFNADSATLSARLRGLDAEGGKVKVKFDSKVIDIVADTSDEFIIDQIPETLQDWKALYNIDVLSSLSDLIKQQIELNIDYDIADILISQIPAAKARGLYKVLDFANLPSLYYNNYKNVIENVIPKLNYLRSRIQKLVRRNPDVLVCGTNAYALLSSLQDYVISLNPDVKGDTLGETGLASSGIAEFAKMKIISSNAIPDNLVFMYPRGNSVADATILLSTYKPLILQKITTPSGSERIILMSRNSVNLLREDNIAVLKFENIDTLI